MQATSDASKSPEQLEREIEEARHRLDSDLDELGAELSPGQLMDRALHYARESGGAEGVRRFGLNLGRAVRDNPVPFTLTAAGITWLAISSRGHDGAAGRARLGVGTQGAEGGEGRKEELRGRAEEARHRLSETAGRARGSARRMRERAQQGRQGMSQRAQQARGGFDRMLQEQPLVIGLAGAALGALMGASIPPSRTEDRLLGRARDQAVAGVAERGREVAQRARESAEQKAEGEGEGRESGERREGAPARGEGAAIPPEQPPTPPIAPRAR